MIGYMKPFLTMIFACYVLSVIAWADDGPDLPSKFIPKTALLIPANRNVGVNWALPMKEKDNHLSDWVESRFRLDSADNVWLCKSDKALACLAKGIVFDVDRPVDDFLWLHNGDFLITSQGHLGFLTFPKKTGKTVPVAVFHPWLTLPINPARLSPAGPGGFFVWGSNPKTGKMCVYLFREVGSKKKKPIRFLFATTKKINAVGGDATHLFVAFDSLIARVQNKTVRGLLDAQAKVRDLVYQDGTGLFYSTDTGAGRLDVQHKSALEFIRSPGVNIALGTKDSLYLKLDAALGILKIDGLSYFKSRSSHPGKR